MGLKDKILAADDIPHEDVEVPEWGVTVRIKGLSGTDRDAYEAKAIALKNQGQDVELRLADFRAKMLIKCLCDPDTGDRLFGDKEASQLGRKHGAVLDRLHDIAMRLSGMGRHAKEAAKGNSGAAVSGSSTTG